jgi:hypothetical protein
VLATLIARHVCHATIIRRGWRAGQLAKAIHVLQTRETGRMKTLSTASSRPIPAEAPVIRTAPSSIGGRAFPATITSPSADHPMSILTTW